MAMANGLVLAELELAVERLNVAKKYRGLIREKTKCWKAVGGMESGEVWEVEV